MKIQSLFLLFILFVFIGCNTDSKENLVVMVKYKTQPNKNVEAFEALKTLISKVQKEDHFEKLKMYVDPYDNSNILLYEEWSDENYYKGDHMKTEHLQQFIGASSAFLAGPPEITYWKLNSIYK